MNPGTLKSIVYAASTIFFALSVFNLAAGQDPLSADSTKIQPYNTRITSDRQSFRMTSLTFGGNGVNLTRVNGQFTIMTGGRGSATFNDRFTIGGGGWGMVKGVSVDSNTEGVFNFIKMGYGGVDLGYLFAAPEKFNAGFKLLMAGGAVFSESVPESKDPEFDMFSVLEPTLFCQVSLSRLFRFEIGASYRYTAGVNNPYITSRELSGFSCYAGFLVSAGSREK